MTHFLFYLKCTQLAKGWKKQVFLTPFIHKFQAALLCSFEIMDY